MFVVAIHRLPSQLRTILDCMAHAGGAARLLRLSSKRLQQRLEGEFSMGFLVRWLKMVIIYLNLDMALQGHVWHIQVINTIGIFSSASLKGVFPLKH